MRRCVFAASFLFIAAIFLAAATAQGALVSSWNFDEASGNALDAVGDHEGVIGAAVNRVSGLIGDGALEFGGNSTAGTLDNYYVDLGARGDVSFDNGFTAELLVQLPEDWVFFQETGQLNITDYSLSFGSMGHFGFKKDWWTMAPDRWMPAVSFALNIGGWSELYMPLTGIDLTDGNVHHLAATYDPATGLKTIYLDGTATANSSYTPGSLISSLPGDSWKIGEGDNRGEDYSILRDEVAVYNHALSASEILQHYQTVQAGNSYLPEASPSDPSDAVRIGPGSGLSANNTDIHDILNISHRSVVLEAGEYDVEDFSFGTPYVGVGEGVQPFLAVETETGYEVIWVGPEVTGITSAGINEIAYTDETFTLSSETTVYAGFTQDDLGNSNSLRIGFVDGGTTDHWNMYDPENSEPNEVSPAVNLGDLLDLTDFTNPDLGRTYAFEINVSLNASPLLPGDANGDGKVDGSDVTILAGNWQMGVSDGLTATWEEGDFNGDGKVDGSDVTILAGNWQAGVTTAAASVPEPGTIVLLLTVIGPFLIWKRRS